MGENIVWFRLVHLKIYKSRYPMMGICFFFAIFASHKRRNFLGEMKHVDVILPLPLDGSFTYSVPEGMEGKVMPGIRVLVPLGKSKKYIAMITRVHEEKPQFTCKAIEMVLDAQPVTYIF